MQMVSKCLRFTLVLLTLGCLAGGPVWGAPTATVTASSFETGNPPADAYDNDPATRWSAYGMGEWIQFAFSESVTLDQLSIAFHRGTERTTYFTVQLSNDGLSWSQVYNGQSSGTSTAPEMFSFTATPTLFVRIVGGGNSDNAWNSYTEVHFPLPTDPTCTDGVRNQDENGIDCGGVCGGDCCGNGYQDDYSGETGVDCGGTCGECDAGTIYYISASEGNDDATGLSPDKAWQTIARVNAADLQPQDSVLFKRGETWREELEITWSGTPAAYISFGTYGTGERPRILGSERAGNWSAVSGYPNVWRSGTALGIPHVGHPASIFFGETNGDITWGLVDGYSSVPSCGSDFTTLSQEYEWCWDGSAVHVYAPENPASRYSFVEVPQRRGAITMRSHDAAEYITIDGLEMMYGTMYGYNDGWPMDYEKRGLIIKNCHIGYIGIRGGNSAYGLVIWHSDMLVQNNDIHDCGRRSISYNVYTDNGRSHYNLVFENVVFENNVLHNGYHTTGFDISHGSAGFDTFQNFTFRNNFIYDDPADNPSDGVNDYTSMALYLAPEGGEFKNFKIHNNVIKFPKQKGFAIGGVHGLEIYNNVIYGMNPNIGAYRPMVSFGGDYQNVRFNNNIIHGTVDADLFESRGIYLGSGMTGVDSWDHNLYFQEDPEQPIAYVYQNYRMRDWDDFCNDTGADPHSPPPMRPLFADPANNDFTLQPGSPAIDAGIDVGLPYDGKAPDIGAYETNTP